ncbi:uroporphyrinogen-III synthase [Falsihalocynthiibacter sp. S25ZX9]|uniref:uroporphyrinogen-III synthase n=1 Tax=Falsihalocynthiibacter sp. S25ZX9 TaxID=3240870 RepID=UPI00350FDE9E
MISKHPALLLTRPIRAAQDFANRLNLGPEEDVTYSPLIEIEYLQYDVGFEAAIFSSRNGVIGAGAGAGRPAYCVGDITAEFARKAGFDVREVGETASALVQKIVSNRPEMELVHLHGAFTRGDVAGRLKSAGVRCLEQVVYMQNALPLTQKAQSILKGENIVVAPLFSPRTAELFSEQIQNLALPLARTHKIKIVALSQNVASQLPTPFRKNIVVPRLPTGDMMLQIVARYFCD